jgi:hypothetical protein
MTRESGKRMMLRGEEGAAMGRKGWMPVLGSWR